MYRYRVFWSIPNAGPSVSTFYLSPFVGADLTVAASKIRDFFVSRAALFPNEVTITFDSAMDSITPATGELNGTEGVTPGAAVTGSGSGTWAAGSGVRVDWQTADFAYGRRVRGRTFLVPAVSAAFGTDGRILPAQVVASTSNAAALITALAANSTPLVVWSRPKAAIGEGPARPGAIHDVTAAVVPSLAATLRGRKY